MAKEKQENQPELDFEAYEKEFDKSFANENEKIERIKKEQLVIALCGDVNAGKSSTINVLTGQDLAVSAKAGETEDIEEITDHPFTEHTLGENTIIADTPGLNDTDEEKSKKTEEYVRQKADIILFFFNAALGPSRPVVDDYKRVQSLGKPIISVLNKIDIFTAPGDKEVMEQQIKNLTGATVVPISAHKNINIDLLHQEIVTVLESKGKELLYLRISTSKLKDEQVDRLINGAAISAAGLGAIPIPGSDIIPLTALQIGLGIKIAFIYECEVTKEDMMPLIAATVTGGLGRTMFQWGLRGMKTLGILGGPPGAALVAIAAAVVAGSVTYGFGHTCKAYYKSGMTLSLEKIEEIFKDQSSKFNWEDMVREILKATQGQGLSLDLEKIIDIFRKARDSFGR